MPSIKDNIVSQKEDAVVIKVENISKKFSRSLKKSMIYGITDITKNIFGQSSNSDKLRKGEFWAVNDVSFELKKGECLGIIGPNGAGKTTLLSMLNGIYMPDKGKISLYGKTGALIAVGAGFHPMLTGRENIYINGAILGMSKEEIDEKFETIIEFADIGDFLDMPVKNYSSGMFVRLGFSVAVHCEPDFLLIDEILSVGDLRFRYKCARKMQQILSKTSIVFVSHNLRRISRICDRVLLLNEGAIVCEGPPDIVIAEYMNQFMDLEVAQNDVLIKTAIEGIKGFDAYLVTENGRKTRELEFGKSFSLNIFIKSEKTFSDVVIVASIITSEGILATIINSDGSEFKEIKVGENWIKCQVIDPRLNPNNYKIRMKLETRLGTALLRSDLGYFRVKHGKKKNKEIKASIYSEKVTWDVL